MAFIKIWLIKILQTIKLNNEYGGLQLPFLVYPVEKIYYVSEATIWVQFLWMNSTLIRIPKKIENVILQKTI